MADVNQGAGVDGAGAAGACRASDAQVNGPSDVRFPTANADPGANLVAPTPPEQPGIAALLQQVLASTRAVTASTQGNAVCVAVLEQV